VRLRQILICALILSCLPGLAAGQGVTNPRGSIVRGQVIDMATDAPMENIRVHLRLATGDTVQSTFTRTNGEFEFNNVVTGMYVLVVEEKGYEPVRESVDLGSAQRQGMTLFLRKTLLPRGEERGSEAVSVQELALDRKTRESFRKGLEKLYKLRAPAASAEYFQVTLEEAPQFFEAHYHLGIALMKLERMEEAEQALRQCIALQGEEPYSRAHSALASLLSSRGEFVQAEAMARQGVGRDPRPWQGHYELARALLELNRTDEAEKSIGESLKRKPDYAPSFLLRANIFIRKRNYPALIRELDQYLRLDPAGPQSDSVRQTRNEVQRRLTATVAAAPETAIVLPPPDPPD
jgi:tetratricopeptide (TPR) repeat protein